MASDSQKLPQGFAPAADPIPAKAIQTTTEGLDAGAQASASGQRHPAGPAAASRQVPGDPDGAAGAAGRREDADRHGRAAGAADAFRQVAVPGLQEPEHQGESAIRGTGLQPGPRRRGADHPVRRPDTVAEPVHGASAQAGLLGASVTGGEPGTAGPAAPPGTAGHRSAGQAAWPGSRLLDLVAVMDRLRTECPWDARQTHESLAPYLLDRKSTR